MPKGKGTYGSKVGRPPKKMNMGGMMSSTKRKPTSSATGLSGMKGGGMMKKKGYASGGMGVRSGIKTGAKAKTTKKSPNKSELIKEIDRLLNILIGKPQKDDPFST